MVGTAGKKAAPTKLTLFPLSEGRCDDMYRGMGCDGSHKRSKGGTTRKSQAAPPPAGATCRRHPPPPCPAQPLERMLQQVHTLCASKFQDE